MSSNATSFVLAVCALAFFKFASVLLARQRNAARAKQLGCQPAPALFTPWWDIIGYTNLSPIIRAAKVGLVVDAFHDRIKILDAAEGRHVQTYTYSGIGGQVILTSDPENLKAILATQFTDFGLDSRKRFFSRLLGDGIFTVDGKRWEHARAMLRPSFIRERVGDLDLAEKHNINLMSAIPVTDPTGWTETIDLQPLFFRLTLDSSTEFLFGESVNSQLAERHGTASGAGDARRELSFSYGFDKAQDICAQRIRLDSLYWLVNPPEFDEACRKCHDFVDHYVRLALESTARDESTDGVAKSREKYNFLEELAQQTRDPVELRFQLLNVLLGGRDTTAGLLGYLLILLSRHPETYAKLRATVLSTFGTYAHPRNLTFATLKSNPYLSHCLSETLRLYPSVPLNARTAKVATSIPRGGGPDGSAPVFVRAGQTVSYSIYVMQRDEQHWGADAAEFRPERWEGRRHGWEYLPFNGGPRVCLGQQFALTSAGYAVVRLVQRFDKVESAEEDPRVRQQATLTSCSWNGVKVRLHEAVE